MSGLSVNVSAVWCRVGARTAIGLVVALHAACGHTLEPPAYRAPTIAIDSSSPSGLSLIWRNDDLRPVGQPIIIGDVVIGIVAEDLEAFVVAIHPATGQVLWRDAITESAIAPGVPIEILKVGDDKVAYLRTTRKDSLRANLVVADARTGKMLAKAPTAQFPSAPIVCANGKDVCAISKLDREVPGQYRLDLSFGTYLVENKVPLRSRYIGDTGLADLGDRPGNTLGLLRNGTLLWRTKASDAFPSGSSTDTGWHWHLYTDEHVFVGTVGNAGTVDDKYYILDLDSSVLAGLSERTGEVLWRDTGSSFSCNLNAEDYRVRCRARGKKWIHLGDHTSQFADLDVIVEGFDPATGATSWSLPMGIAEELKDSARYPAIAGPGQVLVRRPNGPVVLDYAAGVLQEPKQGDTYWCMERASYEVAPPYRSRIGDWTYDRFGGELGSICDESGRPATRLPSIAATMAAGASVGHLAVIATRDGYLGFKAP